MKKVIQVSIFGLLSLFTQYCFSQGIYSQDMIPIEKNGKWGYESKQFNESIRIQFEEARLFYDDRAVVKINGSYGVIDYQGKMKLAPHYDNVELAINQSGKLVSKSLFFTKENSKWGAVNNSGTVIIPHEYDSLQVSYGEVGKYFHDTNFKDFQLKAKRNKKWGIINMQNEVIMPFDFDNIYHLGQDTLVAREPELLKDLTTKLGVHRRYLGRQMLVDYHKDIFYVVKNNKGFLLKNGKNIRLPANDFSRIVRIENSELDLFFVKKNGLWAIATSKKVLTPFQYESIIPHVNDILIIEQEGRYGFINTRGKLLLPPTADYIENRVVTFIDSINRYTKKYHHRIIENDFQNFIHSLDYGVVEKYENGFLFVDRTKDKRGFWNESGNQQIPPIYDGLRQLFSNSGYFTMIENEKVGIIDSTNQIVVIPQYEKIKEVNFEPKQTLITFKKDNLWGVQNFKTGEVIIAPKYDKISYYGGVFELTKDSEKSEFVYNRAEAAERKHKAAMRKQRLARLNRNRKDKKKKDSADDTGKLKVVDVKDGVHLQLLDGSYASVQPFDWARKTLGVNDYYIVSRNEEQGVYSKDGKLLLPLEYDKINDFLWSNQQAFSVRKGLQYGIVNQDNDIIFPFQSKEILAFQRGIVLLDDLTLQAMNGTVMNIMPQDTNTFAFPYGKIDNGILKKNSDTLKVSEDYYLLNTNQQKFLGKTFYDSYLVHENGDTIVTDVLNITRMQRGFISVKTMKVQGFLDAKAGKLKVFDKIQFYANDNTPIRWIFENEKGYLIDTLFQKLNQNPFERVGIFSEGLIAVQQNKKIGFMSSDGNLSIPYQYDSDYSDYLPFTFENNIAYVYKNGKYGFIDKENKIVLPFEYDAVLNHTATNTVAFKNGKWETIDWRKIKRN